MNGALLSRKDPRKGGKLWTSFDVLVTSDTLKQEYLKEGFVGAPFHGNSAVFKFSSKKLYDMIATDPSVPRVVVDLEKKAAEEEENAREKVINRPEKKPLKRARMFFEITRDPLVVKYVKLRTKIAPRNFCEVCNNESRHYTKRGKPTDFDVHHMYGVVVSDELYSTVRACAICHNAITREAKGWEQLNMTAKKKVLLAEYPEIKLLILEELQALRK